MGNIDDFVPGTAYGTEHLLSGLQWRKIKVVLF